jgi:hemerythrin superfamily protein
MTATQQKDVVDLLLDQHNQIKALLGRVSDAQGVSKREAFQDLVRLLAVHESAEEEVVHPRARATIDQGDQVVAPRLHEEHEAKHVLAALYDMGVDHPEFDQKFAEFAEAVKQHAGHEESDEFPALRRDASPDQLRRMAGAVMAAEAIAPTRPHPKSGESATANLIAGPPLAVFDRIRDRMRDWREHNPGQ